MFRFSRIFSLRRRRPGKSASGPANSGFKDCDSPEQFRSTAGKNSAVTLPPPGVPVKQPEWQGLHLNTSLDNNIKMLKDIFSNCRDVVFRQFDLAQNEEIRLALIYTEGLTDKNQVLLH